jgi:hypothetical protein
MPSSKPILGVNDLQSQFPDIAAEAFGWDPETVTSKSNKNKDWKCNKGHIYSSTVDKRTSSGTGCPFCSGHQVLKGYNDLQTKFPEIAAEAYEWNPETVTAGSNQKKDWKCNQGHIYSSTIINRTSRGCGCPFCSGRQRLVGFNDLKTRFPDIAAEAYGWDPTTIMPGTQQKKVWQCKELHIYSSGVGSRTTNGNGCPICSGQQLLAGFNDLQTKFPDIAAEAYGWDPETITAKSDKKKDWQCKEGHLYNSAVSGRTSGGNGCPVCSGRQVLVGFNDLKTKFPDIAAEAYGWDPSTVTAGTNEKKEWKCKEGHIYQSSVDGRTSSKRERGCPFCSGKQVLAGFNDLQTKFPDIAAEAYGWDPSTVTAGTHQKKDWKCKKDHIYASTVDKRTRNGTGCPTCAEYGFDPEKDAWFYLMQRPGEQQLGISNVLVDRLKTHQRNGWTLLEHTIEGSSGKKVQETEALFKKWLKKEIGLIKGTTENWSTISMEVQSLAELKARSGIETDLF